MYVIVTATPYQDKVESAYSIPLGTRVVDSLMHVIHTIQMLLNTSCFFIAGLKLLTFLACQSIRTVETVIETHAAQNMKTTKRWKKGDWGHVITHLMNFSM